MAFKQLTPLLWTEKLNESIAFYTEILGFTCRERNDDWQWASLLKDGTGLMLAHPNVHTNYKEIAFSGSFYFEVDNVETLWQQLQNVTEIVYKLGTFPWEMKEFAIRDNNGYILQFGERIYK